MAYCHFYTSTNVQCPNGAPGKQEARNTSERNETKRIRIIYTLLISIYLFV